MLTVLCAIVLWAPAPLSAQTHANPPAASPAISANQAQTALSVLNDPAKRAAFAATLDAIIKAQPKAAASAPPTPGTPAAASPGASGKPVAAAPASTTVQGLKIPLAPDSLGAQILLSASAWLNRIGGQAMDTLKAVQSLPLLYGWIIVMATNPIAHHLLIDVSWRLLLAVAAAAAAEYALRSAVQRPIRGLERLAPARDHVEAAETTEDADQPADDGIARAEAGESEPPVARRPRPSAWALLKRLPIVVARLLLELIPVIGIALVGHLIAGSALGGQTASRLIILAVVDGYAMCALLLCVVRMLLSPTASRLRLFHLRDSTAAYLMHWSRALILIAVFGYAIGEVGMLMGLSDIAHEALQKTFGLVLHICAAIIVIQKRKAVRRRLMAPAGATGVIAGLWNRIAQVWHWIALFFIGAGWLTWAVEVRHGYVAVLHYFLVTALVLIGARLALVLLLGVVDRIMRPEPREDYVPAGVRARLLVYHPGVTMALRLTIYLLCVLGLLQLYGLNTFLWLVESALGLRILSTSGVLLVTIVLAFAVWEVINAGVQQHLDRLQREAEPAKSARLRTLLPLLRTALLITLALVAGLMVLSEIGINIAPLLAGAGIIGVAIGFGSQKLVQDLITGIFLLLENAMQVGDTVTVSGLSGVVENLSVRTIRLRAGDGSVHIIPFSSVTSVTNVNRGLGNAQVVVSVAYDEDTDRVADELKAIVAEMRVDPELSAKMLSDLQLWGVDKVDGAAVAIAGQVVCTDSGRWAVQREFNRRMKRRFQELGIRIFNPVQTIALSAPALPPEIQGPAAKEDDHGHAQAAN